MELPVSETVTVALPKVNTPYATHIGLEQFTFARDTVDVHPGHQEGVLLMLRRATDAPGNPGTAWALTAAQTQYLVHLLRTACKPPL